MKNILFISLLVLLNCGGKRIALPKAETNDADAAIIFDSTFVVVEPDGRYLSRNHVLIEILTIRGKSKYGEAAFEYYQAYDTVVIHNARTISPEGKVYPIKQGDIKDVPLPAFDRFYIPNVRVKMLTFPNLVEGSYIEYEHTFIMKDPPMENAFDDVVLFEGTDPIITAYYSVSLPKNMNLRYKFDRDFLSFAENESRDRRTFTWSARNVPKIVPEPQMPPVYDVARKVVMSTVSDWPTWSRWYYKMCRSKYAIDEEMSTRIKELCDTLKTLNERITCLDYFVAQKIRYLETTLSGRKGGYEPAAASETYQRRYGVCRDKAALLVAMLRHIGVDAYIVLTNPVTEVLKDIPADQFNHAIVAIKENENYRYLDPTAETSKDWLPGYEQLNGVLVCDSIGEDLAYIPKIDPQMSLAKIKNQVEVREDGSISGRLNISLTGIYDLLFRSWLKDLPPLNREMFIQRMVGGISANSRVTGIKFPDFSSLYTDMNLEIEYESSKYAVDALPFVIFKSPLATGAFDLGDIMLYGGRLGRRQYAMRLRSTFSVINEEVISLPAGYLVESFPDPVSCKTPDYQYSGQFSAKKNKVYFKGSTIFNTVDIPVSKYQELRDLLQSAATFKKGEIIVRRKEAKR